MYNGTLDICQALTKCQTHAKPPSTMTKVLWIELLNAFELRLVLSHGHTYYPKHQTTQKKLCFDAIF